MNQNIKNRIMWIDIATAIAIIAMIIGHTFSYGTTIRNLIFSFHMPLFFVLTGFTMKDFTGWKDYLKQIKKDLIRIIVPCVAFQTINLLLVIFIDRIDPGEAFSHFIRQLIWASAVDVNGYPALGALWFLVVLFWSKTYYSLVRLLLGKYYSYIIFLLGGAFGILLSLYHIYLPQSWDIVFIVALFLWIGRYIKDHLDIFERYTEIISIVAACIWTYLWVKGVYIEIGTRSYPESVLCIFESICGCICIFVLSKALESKKILADSLSYIGRATLIILGVHHLDGWAWGIIYSDSIILVCIKRIIFDLAISMLIVFLIKNAKNILRRSYSS